MTSWGELLASGRVSAGAEIGPLTTYKLGGPARWFCEAPSAARAAEAARAASGLGLDILVLGRGSNLVVSDEGFDGLVIRPAGGLREVRIDRGAGLVCAGSAAPLPVLARRAGEAGLAGLEFYVGIPGSVGGAVAMNAGFYGAETADVLTAASILDMKSGEVTERKAEDLQLGYRCSGVGEGDLVLGASFAAAPGEVDLISARMREATRWRRENQPGGALNAGSVFRNPPGGAAGRIIDSLGLKGLRRGGACVSTRHANFFVADRGAAAQDVYDLVHEVRRLVQERAGILLEPEVRFAGRFRSAPGEEHDKREKPDEGRGGGG